MFSCVENHETSPESGFICPFVVIDPTDLGATIQLVF